MVSRIFMVLAVGLIGGCTTEVPMEHGISFSTVDGGCVLDSRTGLTWERKTTEPGMHRADATYSWYSEDRQVNMSEPGTANGGSCDLERCDTVTFVQAVNEAELCGHNDWRLPTMQEALSLAISRGGPHGHSLDPVHFGDMPPVEIWTETTFRMYPASAWAFDIRTGLERADYKAVPKPARLVRGQRSR